MIRAPDAVRAALARVQALAVRAGAPRVLSVALRQRGCDPLAFVAALALGRPYFLIERPEAGEVVAGVGTELLATAQGAARFSAAKSAVEGFFAELTVIGSVPAAFAVPRAFARFTFFEDPVPEEPFPPATVYLPRLQLIRHGELGVLAVNVGIDPHADIDPLVERLRADLALLAGFAAAAQPPAVDRSSPDRESLFVSSIDGYRAGVAAAVEAMERGEFEKLVLAAHRDLRAPRPFDLMRTVARLQSNYPECTTFASTNARGVCFVGASPERLVRVGSTDVDSDALAGSIARGGDAREDDDLARALLASETYRHEHQIVVDAIRRRFGDLGMRPGAPSIPRTKRLRNIQHLHTPISAARPPGLHVLDAVAALHPTPAVGSEPREVARAELRRYERFARGAYAAPVGWIDSGGRGEFVVAIRSALVDGASARLFAGNGIVVESDPDREVDEVERKFRAMFDALQW
ncbi:MAG: isochorismate synthase [Vulcanimicrobiaceae bacterium]